MSGSIVVVLMGAAALPVPAWGHATLKPSSVEAGSSTTIAVTIPHGCAEASPTTRVRMQLPAGFSAAKPTGPARWSGTVANRVVTWSGPAVASNRKLILGVTITAPGTTGDLALPTVQTCAKGSTSWIQIAKAGAPEPDRPAPMLNVRAAGSKAPTTTQPNHKSH